MNIKNFVFKHVEKIVLSITICYLIYTSVHTFIILSIEVHSTDTKLLSLSNTIERRIKTSVPPIADTELVQVRKLYKDKWWAESFIIEKGETIGEKKIIGKETVDFDTYCKLMEIVPHAQKPLVIKKTAVVQNEKGEFLGSSFTEETHMISVSKIIFEDKKGESYHVWLGESVKVGTDTVAVYPSTNASSTNEEASL